MVYDVNRSESGANTHGNSLYVETPKYRNQPNKQNTVSRNRSGEKIKIKRNEINNLAYKYTKNRKKQKMKLNDK